MNHSPPPVQLVYITAIPGSLNVLQNQPAYMRDRGFTIHAISSPAANSTSCGRFKSHERHEVAISRSITPIRDTVTVLRLWRELRRIRPAIVEAHMSKAGLLGMVAAWLARVPVRIYVNHGVAFASRRGWKRRLLAMVERLPCRLATQARCVSKSVRGLLISAGCCDADHISVVANGSYGVNAASQFNPDRVGSETRNCTRSDLGIPPDALVVGFVGRLAQVKGLDHLATAWTVLREEFPSLHLLLVGNIDARSPIPADTLHLLQSDLRVHLPGFASDPAPLYAAMDLLALPSLHEGFPACLIEGAAMRLPSVASNIPGNTDAIIDGETGTLVPVGDVEALINASRDYLRNLELRRKHGVAGRQRALRDFQSEIVFEAIYQEYLHLMRERGLPPPIASLQWAHLPAMQYCDRAA